jgi:hypothetical protein
MYIFIKKYQTMKNITMLLSCAISILSVQAQIMITRSDFGNWGDKVLYAYDTSLAANFSVGAAGADKVWDFTIGQVTPNYHDSALFNDPTSLSGAPEEANIAIIEAEEPSFYQMDADAVKIIIPLDGFGGGNQLLKIATFPLSYETIVNDNARTLITGTPADFGFDQLPFDSIRADITITTKSEVDGWGTLKIATETYEALRVKNNSKFDIKVEGLTYILNFPIWTPLPVNLNQDQTVYAWYGKDKKYTLAEAELDTNDQVVSFKYQVTNIPTTTGINELNKIVTSYLQPNPANEELNLTFKSNYSEKGTLFILDITGKVLVNQPINITKNENQVTVKTLDMNNGIYFARIISEHLNTSSKFVVKH